jgi:hypothetical protein
MRYAIVFVAMLVLITGCGNPPAGSNTGSTGTGMGTMNDAVGAPASAEPRAGETGSPEAASRSPASELASPGGTGSGAGGAGAAGGVSGSGTGTTSPDAAPRGTSP